MSLHHDTFYDNRQDAWLAVTCYPVGMVLMAAFLGHAWRNFFGSCREEEDDETASHPKLLTLGATGGYFVFFAVQTAVKGAALVGGERAVALCLVSDNSVTFVMAAQLGTYLLFVFRIQDGFADSSFAYAARSIRALRVAIVVGITVPALYYCVYVSLDTWHYFHKKKRSCFNPRSGRVNAGVPAVVADVVIVMTLLALFLRQLCRIMRVQSGGHNVKKSYLKLIAKMTNLSAVVCLSNMAAVALAMWSIPPMWIAAATLNVACCLLSFPNYRHYYRYWCGLCNLCCFKCCLIATTNAEMQMAHIMRLPSFQQSTAPNSRRPTASHLPSTAEIERGVTETARLSDTEDT